MGRYSFEEDLELLLKGERPGAFRVQEITRAVITVLATEANVVSVSTPVRWAVQCMVNSLSVVTGSSSMVHSSLQSSYHSP
ncbi:hypothetical protein KIPB_013712 [Kipferlia bialata]|uniref:Uncharacterized protein n=1 Tax=Kipferlia bialata TaxID=797122 RepID=A0A391NSD2_9EUKA|nr:hypothetical protein KIPB_013712 [Kipferlia bialata]|eukprot:g13712.t1